MIIHEKATGAITGTLTDSAGTRIAGSDLTTFTITLYDKITGDIINSRNAQNILNANGATVSSASGTEGDFSIPLSALDTIILDSSRPIEAHVALLKFTTIAQSGWEEVAVNVKNTLKIT